MNDQSQAKFLLIVLKHTPMKINARHLSTALNISLGATTMRLTRLRRKLARNDYTVQANDMEFLLRALEFCGGKVNIKDLAEETGLKVGAVSMRLTRLRRKYGIQG